MHYKYYDIMHEMCTHDCMHVVCLCTHTVTRKHRVFLDAYMHIYIYIYAYF